MAETLFTSVGPESWQHLPLAEVITKMREQGINKLSVGYGTNEAILGAFILIEGEHTERYLEKFEELEADLDEANPTEH